MNEHRLSKKKEISALLSVIIGGVVFALIAAVGCIYFYSPSGLYHTNYALLSPDMIDQLRYQDVDPSTGKRQFFYFHSIELTYFDSESSSWQTAAISREKYRNFFDAIRDDVSIEEESSSLAEQFLSGYPALLKIVVQSEERRFPATKTFQEVAIAYLGNHYRIEIRQESSEKQWAYFFHRNIYATALEILK